MWPVIYENETIRVHTYSLAILVAFVVGFVGLRARLHRLGCERLPGILFLVSTVVLALTGSHLYWLVLKRGPEHAWRAIYFLESGHVFYGGLIAALLWTTLYCRLRHIEILILFACAAPALALSYAIGRLGCLAAGCCWGRTSDVWWAIRYPPREFGAYAQHVRRGAITVLEPFSLPVHPTPVYEAFGGVLLFACLDLLLHKRNHPMAVVSTFLFGYGALRFCIEFFRGDSFRYSPLGLTAAQFISLGIGTVGMIGFCRSLNLRKQQTDNSPLRNSRNGFSLTELLAVVAIVSLLAAILLPALGQAREGARRAVCQNNLRSWGQIFAMYSSESDNRLLPPMQFDLVSFSDVDIALAPRIGAVYPEYATDPALLRCPSDSAGMPLEPRGALFENPAMADMSYVYTGYVFDKVGEASPSRPLADLFGELPMIPASALQEAQNIVGPAQLLGVGRSILARTTSTCLWPLANDLLACGYGVLDGSQNAGSMDGRPLGNGASTVVHRLAADSGRHVEGGASAVWVMFDSFATDVSVWNHTPGGSNVLYLDGHVEFVPYSASGNGAINPRMANILEPILNRPRLSNRRL